MREPRGERHAAMQAKRCVSALRCRQLPPSIAHDEGNLPLSEPVKGVTLISKLPGIWRMSADILPTRWKPEQ